MSRILRTRFALVACLLLLSVRAAAQDGLTGAPFAAASYEFGESFGQFELSDVDHDGHIDILAPSSLAPFGLTVAFGRPGGLFGPTRFLDLAVQPAHAAAADLDGDGDLEVMACSSTLGEIFLFENLGDRSFGAAVRIGQQPSATNIAFADVDRDGLTDALVLGARIAVFLGDGAGGLTRTTDIFLFAGGDRIHLTDVNSDGEEDIIITEFIGDDIQVVESTPTGFGFATLHISPFPLQDPIVRDGDGDGLPDVIGVAWQADDLILLPGLGDGTFGPAIRGLVPPDPISTNVGDFDGDGENEFVIVRQSNSFQPRGRVQVIDDTPGSVFGNAGPEIKSGAFPQATRPYDFDRDGKLDVAVMHSGGIIAILLGRGDGSLEAASRSSAGEDPRLLLTADFTGRGRNDLAVYDGHFEEIRILRQVNDDTFSVASIVGLQGYGTNLRSFAAGDLDLDGDPDILAWLDVTNGGWALTPFLNDGTGVMTAGIRVVDGSAVPSLLELADLDDDGVLDAVSVGDPGGVVARIGMGDGTFASPVAIASHRDPRDFAIGDVDADGWLDIVEVEDSRNEVLVHLGTGGGSFAPVGAVPSGFADSVMDIALGDIDGDGRLDSVTSGRDGGGVGSATWQFLVMLGNGDGTFVAGSPSPSSDPLVDLRTVDLDIDGRADVWAGRQINSRVIPELRYGRADGSLSAKSFFGGSERARGYVLADLDRDGNSDLITTNTDCGEVMALLHRADTRLDIYCDADVNSTGHPTELSWQGNRSLASANLMLTARNMPIREIVIWFTGVAPAVRPVGAGTLCIGGRLARTSSPRSIGATGTNSLGVTTAGLPLVAGSTWYFQAWYTDASGAPPQFNFSDAVAVRFLP